MRWATIPHAKHGKTRTGWRNGLRGSHLAKYLRIFSYEKHELEQQYALARIGVAARIAGVFPLLFLLAGPFFFGVTW